ncbi:MAG: rRNA maturation RNase YbeY [Pseudomonadota bacterium]
MIEVIEQNGDWDSAALQDWCQTALAAVCARLDLPAEDVALSVLAADDARIATLNAEFRGKPTPTNVLSWPAHALIPPALPPADFDGAIELGDIALAHGVCTAEAAAQKKPFEHHVTHLLVHGMLHLLGYDHESDAEAAVMEGLEVEILGNLEISDPYSADRDGP